MKKKIVTIIGARPQIIKSAAISRAIQNEYADQVEEIVVHTGQHYDENMSDVFFGEMGIPQPNYNLGVGSGSHGRQTADMLVGIEDILLKEQPSALLVYGDTNSTLAGATAASKLNIPIVHVEAGLRSYNKSMPEEVNRIVCDHLSTLLFSPTKTGYDNLIKEGFTPKNAAPFTPDNPKIYHCGDIMYDNSLYFSTIADKKATVLADHHLEKGNFFLCTIHRGNNTDDPTRLTAIFEALLEIVKQHPTKEIVLPLHPRTLNCLSNNLTPAFYQEVQAETRLKIIPPVSFLNIIALEKHCELVITDSGGLQKEAFFFQKPCVILRPETEWVEIVENGNARIVDANREKIIEAVDYYLASPQLDYPDFYGDGAAAEFIVGEVFNV